MTISPSFTGWRGDRPGQIAVGRCTAAALGLLSAPLVARALGPEGRGETAAVLAGFYLLPILMALGLPLEVRRLVATTGDLSALRGARSLAVAGAPLALVVAWSAETTVYAGLSDGAGHLALAGLALSPVSVLWMCDQSALIALQRYRCVAVLQVVQPAVLVVGVLAEAATGVVTVRGVLLSSMAGTVATALVAMSFVQCPLRGPKTSLLLLVRGGCRYAGSSIAEAASNRLDQVAVLPLLGAAQAGIYAVAVTVGAIPLAVGHALGASSFNRVARADAADRPALKLAALRTGLSAGLACAVVLGLLTPLLVTLAFGPAFQAAVPVVLVAVVGSAFAAGAYVASMALAADGLGWRMTTAQVAALSLGIVLLLALAPLGALGAALASTTSYVTLYAALFMAAGARVGEAGVSRLDLVRAVRSVGADVVTR